MAYRIQVSRHGLTRCPACRAHMKIAAEVGQTVCPFCDETLHVALADGSSGGVLTAARGLLATGRSGLLAASLLSLSVASGCGVEEDDPPADTSNADADASGDASGDTTVEDVDNDDTQNVALYGLPPEDIQVDTAPDGGNEPEYGVPPDPDASDATDMTEDSGTQPAYGIPADTNP